MPALFIYLLKVNIALIAFCLGYYLVLRKLTFYTLNRFYLVLGIIFSSIYPFVDVDSFIQRFKQLEPLQQVVVNLKAPAEKLLDYAWYWNWAAMIFWLGAAVFTMRLVVQFISLHKIYRRSTPDKLQQYNVRITDADISPFSFWQSIFINPDNIEAADLQNILEHEQVHVKQWHTLDILLTEISTIFYWFNPGIWFMKKAVSENIEFITDRKILQNGMDSKAYQYSLLNVSLGTNASPNITSHFNFATLKKRIRMMNAQRSSNVNLTRYAILVPAVLVCLCVFSISKANIINQSKVAYQNISTSVKEIVGGPLAEVTVKPVKKIRRLLVHLIDTIPEKSQPAQTTFQIKSDSAITSLTFDARKTSSRSTSYLINGHAVSADEFQARRPHIKADTINIVARFTESKNPGEQGSFTTIRTDRPDYQYIIKASQKDDAQETSAQNKHIDKIIFVKSDKDSTNGHSWSTIRAVRINGKNVTSEDIAKLTPELIKRINITDLKKVAPDGNTNDNAQPPQTKTKDLDITVKDM